MARPLPGAPVLFADAPLPVPLRRSPRPRRPKAVPPVAPVCRPCANCEREYAFLRRGLCRSCYREMPAELRATFDDLRTTCGFDALPPVDRLRILRSKMSARIDGIFATVFAEPRPTEADALARAFGTPITPTAPTEGQETDR